jgi:hypothetical protein
MAPQRLPVEHIFCGKSSSCRLLFLHMGGGGVENGEEWLGGGERRGGVEGVEGRGDEGYFTHFIAAYAHLHQLY